MDKNIYPYLLTKADFTLLEKKNVITDERILGENYLGTSHTQSNIHKNNLEKETLPFTIISQKGKIDAYHVSWVALSCKAKH